VRFRNQTGRTAAHLAKLSGGVAAAFLLGTSPAAAKDCSQLAAAVLPTGKVTAAELTPAGAFKPPPGSFPPPGIPPFDYTSLPAFCRIKATLTPTADSDIKVEVWMPANGWNGKFVGIGNGVWAGSISYFELGGALARGYAAGATDTGHAGNGLTGDFAVGHPEKLVDFGHRSIHEMTVAAKQLVTGFYGAKPRFSLWNSCSTGGRQGLMEAYRYPEDYDAISAMAPANPMTMLMTQTMWTGYQALRAPGANLSRSKLTALHQAWLAHCDASDGLEDKLVGRPDACSFDPGTLQCKGGDAPDCLTADQVQTMRAIYEGVRDRRTGKLVFAGFSPGSEVQLAFLIGGPEPFPVATSYMRALVFADSKWNFRSFDYGADLDRAREYGQAILDVPADGLDKFFARGGRLLLSHGWNDGLIPATNTVRFYRALAQHSTSASARNQVRLFMVPGMDHCAGGEGPSSIDTIGVIDRWVTEGKAPERIVAKRPAGQPPLSRPLCPYPAFARYRGTGSQDDAENFECAMPPSS